MPKYTLRFTRTKIETYKKTVSAKDAYAAQEKAGEIEEAAEAHDARFDKDTDPQTEYGFEVEEA